MVEHAPEDYLKEHAPDVTIVRSEPFPKSLENYDTGTLDDKTKDMIQVVLDWLSSPLVKDAVDSDSVRIQREDEFPEDVVDLLKHHKAHPNSVHNVTIALNILSDSDENLPSELANIIEQYKTFNSLRNHLHDTQTMVWKTIDKVLSKDEINELTRDPHPFINRKTRGNCH